MTHHDPVDPFARSQHPHDPAAELSAMFANRRAGGQGGGRGELGVFGDAPGRGGLTGGEPTRIDAGPLGGRPSPPGTARSGRGPAPVATALSGSKLLSDHTDPGYRGAGPTVNRDGGSLFPTVPDGPPPTSGHGIPGPAGRVEPGPYDPPDYDPYAQPHGDQYDDYDLVVDQGYAAPAAFAGDAPTYRPSPIWAALNMLRPSGTKLLVGATVLVFLATAGHTLGIVSLPFLGGDDGGQDIASDSSNTTVTASGPTSPPSTDVTRFGAAAGDSTTAPSTTTTSESVTTPTTTAEEPPPVEDPEPTEPEPTPTEPEPTTPTTEATTSTTEPTTSTSTTSTTQVERNEVSIEIGEAYTVPDDLPAGSYRANLDDAGCAITILDMNDEPRTVTGEVFIIRFDLADGDAVTFGEGCPLTYRVT